MPPCAYSEEDSRREFFAMTRTSPASANSMAARIPATPAPITRKSQSIAKVNFTNGMQRGYGRSIEFPNRRDQFFHRHSPTDFPIMELSRRNAQPPRHRNDGLPLVFFSRS